ncbi:MAG: cation-translocating P-type ATPase [Gammaproteobacteria bacterium]|nr:cation-translocating P-type ATPase [Gammaproteobacteria bacterium]
MPGTRPSPDPPSDTAPIGLPDTGAAGLSEAEALRRLEAQGYNELPSDGRRSLGRILLEVLSEPMFMLQLAAGGIYLLIGEAVDAATVLGFVVIVIGITFYQSGRAERALAALRELSSPRALVMRDGRWRRIAGREVVMGDRLRLGEGDRVPADLLLVSAHDLAVDESPLTGESVPVDKSAWPGQGSPDTTAHLAYAGCLVVRGQGESLVLATGTRSALGRIGASLRSLSPPASPLNREIRRLVRVFALAAIGLSAGLVLLHGLRDGQWYEGALAGITLAMAILPEEFPVVFTVFLALGAWRLAGVRVLTRRPSAIETLGSVGVACVDKTGTLTQNRMAVRRLVGAEDDWAGEGRPGPGAAELLHWAELACEPDAIDPMEVAIRELASETLPASEAGALVQDYPRTDERPAMIHVWQDGAGPARVALKGAPECALRLAGIAAEEQTHWLARAEALAGQGLRVLGIAAAHWPDGDRPEDPQHFPFRFLGLLGLADPLREEVPAAIAQCRAAGVRVVMITGDFPATALAIAGEAGLDTREGWLGGDALEHCSDRELATHCARVNVYARIRPAQKLRLVRAFQAAGAVVAMTGDGINDAPALKAADIGIAMGQRGTDVAREAGALVLLDDNFASLVAGLRQGRRVLDNLRKAMAYILAVHLPFVGLALLPPLLHWPTLFMPVHILFLELIIDPACSLVFEAEEAEADLMRRPPRDPGRAWFDGQLLGLGLALGACALLPLLALLAWGQAAGLEAEAVRGQVFLALVIADLGMIISTRAWHAGLWTTLRRPNRFLNGVAAATLAMLILIYSQPALSRLFHVAPLSLAEALLAIASGLSGLLAFECLKPWLKPRRH